MKMYYSLTEAANILGYSNGDVIRVLIHRDKIKGVKIGRNWLIHYKELEKRKVWLNEKQEKRIRNI
jgi:excisionase family DNA binding protein